MLKAEDVKLERGQEEVLLHAGWRARQWEGEERGCGSGEIGTSSREKTDLGRYLTLRVLSSLDQESVEGKEGRDEEEVTNALLPI